MAPFATPAGAVPALAQPSMTASPLIASPPAASLKPVSPGSEAVVDVQPANCTLFVANIGQSCTEQDLRDVFGT